MCESVRQCSCCWKLLLAIKGSINAGNVEACRGFVENSGCAGEQYLLCAACSLKRHNFYFRAVANCLELFRAGPSINTTRLPSFCNSPSKAVSKYSADVQVFLYFPLLCFTCFWLYVDSIYRWLGFSLKFSLKIFDCLQTRDERQEMKINKYISFKRNEYLRQLCCLEECSHPSGRVLPYWHEDELYIQFTQFRASVWAWLMFFPFKMVQSSQKPQPGSFPSVRGSITEDFCCWQVIDPLAVSSLSHLRFLFASGCASGLYKEFRLT